MKGLRIGMTLAIAIVGVALFEGLGLPLPWLLGPMFAGLFVALLGAPLEAPPYAAPVMRTVLGVAIGTAITPS